MSKQTHFIKSKDRFVNVPAEFVDLSSGKVEGWTNWYTWTIFLHFNNTEPIYQAYGRELQNTDDPDSIDAAKAQAISKACGGQYFNSDIADHISKYSSNYDPADLMDAVVDVIDWQEIADHMLDDWIDNVLPDKLEDDPDYYREFYPEYTPRGVQ